MKLLHSLQTFFGRLLGLLGVVGVVDGSLQTASDIIGILVALVLASRLEITRVKNL